MNWAAVENMVTIIATVAVILGVWFMGGGPWSFIGLAIMLNINTSYPK